MENSKNLNNYLTASKLPFNETEKNAIAFKGLYSVQNTSTFKEEISDEVFSKSFPVYNDDIITNASQIPFNPTTIDGINPYKRKVWVMGENLEYDTKTQYVSGSVVYDPIERLYRGYFSESINPNGNPNIEEIIMPLTKVYGNNNQYYVAFAKENMTHNEFKTIFSDIPNEPDGIINYKHISSNILVDKVQGYPINKRIIKPGDSISSLLNHFPNGSPGSTLIYLDPTLGSEKIPIERKNDTPWNNVNITSDFRVEDDASSNIPSNTGSFEGIGSYSTSSYFINSLVGNNSFYTEWLATPTVGVAAIFFSGSGVTDGGIKNFTVGNYNFGDFNYSEGWFTSEGPDDTRTTDDLPGYFAKQFDVIDNPTYTVDQYNDYIDNIKNKEGANPNDPILIDLKNIMGLTSGSKPYSSNPDTPQGLGGTLYQSVNLNQESLENQTYHPNVNVSFTTEGTNTNAKFHYWIKFYKPKHYRVDGGKINLATGDFSQRYEPNMFLKLPSGSSDMSNYPEVAPATDHKGNNIKGTGFKKNRRVTLKEASSQQIFINSEYILKNFISPFKFGLNYNITLSETSLHGNSQGTPIMTYPPTPEFARIQYPTSDELSENVDLAYSQNPPTEVLTLTSFGGRQGFGNWAENGQLEIDQSSNSNENHPQKSKGGILFDYKEGSVFVGVPTKGNDNYPTSSSPDISLHPSPIWMRAFRYVGPTGFSVPSGSNSQYENLTISANVISASHIDTKVLNIDGVSITSLETTDVSGNSSFGSGPSDIHTFKGNLNITESVFINMNTSFVNIGGPDGALVTLQAGTNLNVTSGDIEVSGNITASKLSVDEITDLNGTITGFLPYTGNAIITGSLLISGSTPFIHLSESNTGLGDGKIYNLGGNLYWGNTLIGNDNNTSGLSADPSPSLISNLDLNGKNITDISAGSSINLNDNVGTQYIKISNDKINFSPTSIISQSRDFNSVTNTLGQTIFVGDVTLQNNGTLLGTASVAETASYALISSQSISSSHALTASYIELGNVIVGNADTASYIEATNIDGQVGFPFTGSAAISGNLSLEGLNGNLTASGNISASGLIFTSTSNASGVNYHTLLIDTSSGQFYHTGSYGGGGGEGTIVIANNGGGDNLNSITIGNTNFSIPSSTNGTWYEGGTYLSSSFPILISESLSIGSPYSSSTLTVSSSILISNTNDAITPDLEGILIHSYGTNNNTIGIIDFNSSTNTGIKIINNGSNTILDEGSTPSDTFNITQYSPTNTLGTSKFTIKNNGNIGIFNKPNPTYEVHIGGTTHFDKDISINTSKFLNSFKSKFNTIQEYTTNAGINFISNTKFTNLDAQAAVIGRKRDIELGYQGKILDFFNDTDNEYSLYVRNGALIMGGDILPDVPSFHSLGSKRFPWKDIHVNKGTIIFYDDNSEVSSSDATPIAKIGVEGTTALNSKIDFKFGGSLEEPISSIQFFNGGPTGQQGQIAVNTNGLHSTLLRAEDQSRGIYGADYVAGSIVQKGSGSFTILLDADDTNANRSKFSIESNAAIPGSATKLLTVSESGETRAYGHLKVDDYITTTNITASGNISSSGTITGKLGTTDTNVDAPHYAVIQTAANTVPFVSNAFSINPSTNTTTFGGNTDIGPNTVYATNITASGNISSSNNLYSKRAYFYDDESAYLAADTNPILHLKNTNVGGNADSYIKFESTDNGSHYSVGIDTNRNTFVIGSGSYLAQDVSPPFSIKDDKIAINVVTGIPSYTLDVGGDIRSTGTLRVDVIQPQTYGPFGTPTPYNSLTLSSSITASGHIQFAGNISGSHTTTASFGSLQLSNLPTTPTGLPTGSVWVSGSKNNASTNNVNCGTLMIVI